MAQNAQEILGWTTIAVTTIALIATYDRTLSGIGATLAGGKFKYRIDKSRLPVSLYSIIALAIVTFVYGLLIGRQVGLAFEFCILTTFFGGIGIVLKLVYIPKD